MMTNTQFLSNLIRLRACSDAIAYVKSHPRWSVATLWRRCDRPDWLLWLAGAAEIDRKTIVRCACDCARASLRYVTPGDDRPRLCVETVERWCDGEATMDDVYAAWSAAWSAALSDAWSAAWSAESSAEYAAWSAEAAARAAEYAAESAAWSAAWSAESASESAWYAAWSAESAAERNAVANHCRLIRKRITAQMIVDALEAQESVLGENVVTQHRWVRSMRRERKS